MSGNDLEIRGRLAAILATLGSDLVERDTAIRLAMLATLAGEHLLLVGPPGTAKSLVARRLHLAVGGAYFERLLTRFSVPEELFGPLSIKGLECDRYERLLDGYLPSATIGFLDEIFKANSAILNSLLTLLNEREFDNGTKRLRTPLATVIGASNELPEDGELDALFDRFLLRLHVDPVSDEGFSSLLALRGVATPAIDEATRLSAEELAAARTAADRVVMPDEVLFMLQEARVFCVAEQIKVSDRRWRKVGELLRMSAWSNGRGQVSKWDCWLLQHCLWNTPSHRQRIYAWYCDRIGVSTAANPEELQTCVLGFEKELEYVRARKEQSRDNQEKLIFLDNQSQQTTCALVSRQECREGKKLYIFPPGARGNSYRSPNAEQIAEINSKGVTERELNMLEVPRAGKPGEYEQFSKWSGRDSYLQDINNEFPSPLKNAPLMQVVPKTRSYLDAQLKELRSVHQRLTEHRTGIQENLISLEQEIIGHLWIEQSFSKVAAVRLAESRAETDRLLKRVETLESGFQTIPLMDPTQCRVRGA